MDRVPTAQQLEVAARASVLMAYVLGLGGVAGGVWLLRADEIAMAIVLWLVTFAVGTVLMGTSLLIRALGGITARLARLEGEVRVLAEHRAGDRWREERDPWRGH
ncbi:MAG: hypothetical protein ACLFS9_05905 [Nitriliruptoraceae bacterium]